MNPKRSSPALQYFRFLVLAALLAAAVAGAGYVPTRNLAGPEGVVAMLVGCGVSLVGSVIAAVPVALASANQSGSPAKAALASMVIRFIMVLTAGLTLALTGWLARGPLLIWIGISYMVLLVADTRYTMQASDRTESTEK